MEHKEEKMGFLGKVIWGTFWFIGLVISIPFAIVGGIFGGICELGGH